MTNVQAEELVEYVIPSPEVLALTGKLTPN